MLPYFFDDNSKAILLRLVLSTLRSGKNPSYSVRKPNRMKSRSDINAHSFSNSGLCLAQYENKTRGIETFGICSAFVFFSNFVWLLRNWKQNSRQNFSFSPGLPVSTCLNSRQVFLDTVVALPHQIELPGLNSIESEITLRKLLFLGRMITENKFTSTVRNLFRYRVDSFFDENISSLGILPSICEALRRYKLFDYFKSWFHNSTFANYSSWKSIVKNIINKYEESAWNEYPLSHPNLDIARACLENVPPLMCSGLLPIFIRTWLPADMFRLD